MVHSIEDELAPRSGSTTWRRRLWRYGPAVLWAGLIFYYVLTENLARILITFAVTDLIFAAVIFYYLAQGPRNLA